MRPSSGATARPQVLNRMRPGSGAGAWLRVTFLDEQTTPVGLALTDVWTSVPAVSFSGLDLNANRVEGNVSWTPPVCDANVSAYETCLATDATDSAGALGGSMAVGTKV